ncbi:stage II sporulation protein P [Priestia megaterium]|uniref:stage II sporulation protein P n=1 Tax=Priestia megaterium TaxID=1404 RepID=UPI002079DE37|nr:stage II sporulation protein P [Priestia megaterium]USL39639.1 stage II sporulation protein P [Priestia megaterium]
MRARTEQEWIRLLKDGDELKPDQEYIHQTRKKLLYEARKLRSKREKKKVWRIIWPSMMAVALAAVLVVTVVSQTEAPKPHSSTYSNLETASKPSQIDKNTKVFIYNTHSRESFETKEIAGYNQAKNVQTVAKDLGRYLKQQSISNTIDDTDYVKLLLKKDMEFKDIYKLSRKSVKKAVKDYPNVQLMLDIHRGAGVGEREITTTKINGKSVAKVQFFVSNSHLDYSENLKMAVELDHMLNEMYPGISRGVIQEKKDGYRDSLSYNQDLHPGALMINIGGVENTLKEEKRTAKMLATAIKRVLNRHPN